MSGFWAFSMASDRLTTEALNSDRSNLRNFTDVPGSSYPRILHMLGSDKRLTHPGEGTR